MSQQSQALNYFKSHAEDWQNAATSADYNIIDNRHRAVFEAMKSFPKGSSLLDIGCGTGQLAIEASTLGWTATGVDFAQEMVDLCIANNKAAKAKATFECASVFEYKHAAGCVDIISAQGFIEYISLEQLDAFLDYVYATLKPDGVLALGSRNRLFNLHSLNTFTDLESALGTTDRLLAEARILQSSQSVDVALDALGKLNYIYDQPEKHPVTGVTVETRYQFSPADLITRFTKHGLKAVDIYPVHYHPLPLSLMGNTEMKRMHMQLAKYATDHWITHYPLVPYASSFVLAATKL